jgi:DNA-binding transcriptional ArsR family regulator
MRPSFLDPGTVLFGKTRRRVLGLLFGHPDEAFYVRDIVRRSGAAQGAIARELDALLGAGLLRRHEDGRNVYYQANKDAPVFPELERLVVKTIALSDTLREALTPLAQRIEFAVIFGSAAHGQLKSDRGTDLVVIGDVRPAEVADALAAMKQRRALNAKVYPMTEFRKKVADSPRFFTSFLSGPPLIVIGEPDDFFRLRVPRSPRRTNLR